MKKIKEKQLISLTPHFKCGEGLDMQLDAAAYLLRNSGLSVLDSARLSLELVEALGGCCDMLRIRRLIQLGAEALRAEEESVSFEVAVEKCLELKSHRSVRTVQDIWQTYYATATRVTMPRCTAIYPAFSWRWGTATAAFCSRVMLTCEASPKKPRSSFGKPHG